MKHLTVLLPLCLLLAVSPLSLAGDFDEPEDGPSARLRDYTDAQMRAVKTHQTLAFTSAGLLLGAGGMGLYHFLEMQRISHRYRDRIGFVEDSGDPALQAAEIRKVWGRADSQAFRICHAALIGAAFSTYSATAAIELSWPNIDRNSSPLNNTKIHRTIFLLHASMMLANIGLGFAESYALSRGDHELAAGLGVAHAAIGFSVPVVMVASGLAFKIPEN